MGQTHKWLENNVKTLLSTKTSPQTPWINQEFYQQYKAIKCIIPEQKCMGTETDNFLQCNNAIIFLKKYENILRK
jgi:hypothetical protein